MEMPEEMRKALYGASSTDEKRDPFLEFVQPIPNPWTPRSADDKRVMFEGEDDEEKQYSEVHQPLERIFRGVPDTATCEPASGRFRFSKQEPTAPADALHKSAHEVNLREYIQRCLDGGDTLEELAEWTEQTDAARAEEIRRIGKALVAQGENE